MQKIDFNGHHLMYFDTAVAGHWRAMAMPYQATMDSLGGDLCVRKATLDHHASARFDELVDVGVKTARIGNSSMLLPCAVFRADELLVAGELVYVFANPAKVLLHAKASAAVFYRRAGFVPLGPVFEETGLPHQAIVCLGWANGLCGARSTRMGSRGAIAWPR